jgi:hypothetical protein
MWILLRISYAIKNTLLRLIRLLTFYVLPFYHRNKGHSLFRSWVLLLLDVLFFFDVYEIISNTIKHKTRPLTNEEITTAKTIFGSSLQYNLIRIDDEARIMTKDKGIIYVGFNTINSWGAIREDIFIHELVHVWQYQHFGAGYITNALKAQVSEAGYNYAYTEGWYKKKTIHDFNAEQQADLVQDFYRLKNGFSAQWQLEKGVQLTDYQHFIDEIRTIK